MNIYELPVHRSADLFPMLSNDELQEMADDIKENGQIHPVVTGVEKDENNTEYLIDGRNRLAACKLAGIEPRFTCFAGDINTFINSANNIRRELTKGQKAMSYAVMFPLSEVGRNQHSEKEGLPGGSPKPSEKNLSYARTILKYKPELQAEVLSKVIGLNAAYDSAMERKREQEELTEESDSKSVRMAELQNTDEKLYDLVVEGAISLNSAETEINERVELHIQEVRNTMKLYETFVMSCHVIYSDHMLNDLLDALKEAPEHGIRGLPLPNKDVLKHLKAANITLPKLIEELEK